MSFLSPYNEEQFVALVRQRLPFFRGLALRILKNAEDTDDAVQTALLKGWSRRLFLRTPEKLSAWVSRIILNESYNILRRKKKEKSIAADVAADEPTAGASAERERLLQRLEEAIAPARALSADHPSHAVAGHGHGGCHRPAGLFGKHLLPARPQGKATAAQGDER